MGVAPLLACAGTAPETATRENFHAKMSCYWGLSYAPPCTARTPGASCPPPDVGRTWLSDNICVELDSLPGPGVTVEAVCDALVDSVQPPVVYKTRAGTIGGCRSDPYSYACITGTVGSARITRAYNRPCDCPTGSRCVL